MRCCGVVAVATTGYHGDCGSGLSGEVVRIERHYVQISYVLPSMGLIHVCAVTIGSYLLSAVV